MIKCDRCRRKLHRVHRIFLERFQYLAIYEYLECDTEQYIPRPYFYNFGPNARCPRCGTFLLSRLKGRGHIAAMRGGPMNLLNRFRGGKLAHCNFCRLEFYDTRPVANSPQNSPPAPDGPELDTARL